MSRSDKAIFGVQVFSAIILIFSGALAYFRDGDATVSVVLLICALVILWAATVQLRRLERK